MKTIKTQTSVSGKVVELFMIKTATNLEYYFIHIDGDLAYSQYDNNDKLNAIFNECINDDFNLIYA